MTIPSGWALCDGNNGTPDLRSRFVIGATGSFNPGDVGGDPEHEHDFNIDSHTHNVFGAGGLAENPVKNFFTTASTDSGITDSASIMPPWYSLAYIQKVGS